MGWADWMVVKLPFEEELTLEQQVREIKRGENPEATAELCAALTKAHAYQNRLLKQAVARITELEAMLVAID